MLKTRTAGYREYIEGIQFQKQILLTKKEYLNELMEDCLHNMERECDLIRYEERVKKLKKSKEI